MKRTAGMLVGAMAVGVIIAFSPAARADLHRFESADGSKSFYAELLRFDDEKKIVTVRRVSGKEINFPLAVLGVKSREFVESQKEVLAAGRWLRMELSGEWGERKVTKGSTSKTITSQRIYTAEFTNYGKLPLTDLEVTYDVHLFRDDGKEGSRSVRSRTEKVSYLTPGVDRAARLEPVVLSQTMPLSAASGSAGGG